MSVSVRRIPAVKNGEQPLLIKDFFGENALLLQAADYEHYAVHAGPYRYDAQAMRPARWQGPNPEATVPTGIFFHFPGMPVEKVRKIQALLQEEPARTSVTCVHGACRLLEGAGIRLKEGVHTPTEQADTLMRILREGFVDEQGRPYPIEVFVNSDKSMDDLLKLFEFSDKRYHRAFRMHARKLGGTAAVIKGVREAGGVDLVTEQLIIDALGSVD